MAVPGAPTSVAATANGYSGQILVTWTPPSSDGGSAIIDYTVTTVLTVFSVPDAPAAPTATPGDSRANVYFNAPTFDGNSPIIDYTVTSTPGSFTATGSSPLTVNGLTDGTSYTFTVKARNAIGFSAASSASGSIIPVVSTGVASYLTTPDKAHLLEAQTSLPLVDVGSVGTPTVTVDVTQRYQTMDGFGASLTESAASVLNTLTTGQRSQVISSLFSPTNGAGLSFLRQPMGASDFALSNYTYDDMPAGQTDPTLASFSISRDLTMVIPQLQQALAANPAINIMASPWSPPAWMKTGDSLIGSAGGTLRSAAYDAYAAYFVKFVQGYASHGVTVGAVTVQNEPEFAPSGYPGMPLSAADEAAFIPHLAAALSTAGLNTKIIAFDHNWDLSSYATSVLGDSTAGPLVDGVAFHCYGGDVSAQSTVHDAYPGKNIYFTECSGGAWSPDFAANLSWETHNLVIGATRNWAKTVATWNLALDTNYGPTNGGCTNCTGLITVNTATGAVTYNDSYYALGQIAKVAHPGAVRIASTSDPNGVETVAFQNQNGSYALVTHNTTGSAAPLTVREGQYAFQTTLPAGAVQSFTWY
jgi:glucosylceramidase